MFSVASKKKKKRKEKKTAAIYQIHLWPSLSILLQGHEAFPWPLSCDNEGKRRYRLLMIALATIHLSPAESVGGRETVRMYDPLLVVY